jgi:rhomboid protease GluP
LPGALIVLLKSNRLPVPPRELKKLRKSVIYFAVLNLVLGLSDHDSAGSVSSFRAEYRQHGAHGRLCLRVALCSAMVPRIGSPGSFSDRRNIAVALVVGVLVLFGFYLAQLPGNSDHAHRARVDFVQECFA